MIFESDKLYIVKTQADYFCSLLLTTFLLLTLECSAQSTSKKELYYKDFNWTITIPENFEKVAPEVREKMEERGVSAIEDTYGGKVENKAKSIFIFSSGQTNYFESNYQPF